MAQEAADPEESEPPDPPERVPFEKPPRSVHEQLKLLESRGLIVADRDEAKRCLSYVPYYRLSIYCLEFQNADGGEGHHQFHAGTTFEDVFRLYDFDRKLRLLVIDALERIEVAVRAALTNVMAVKYGANWYEDSTRFRNGFDHDGFMMRIEERIGHDEADAKKRPIHIRHFYRKYHSPDMPPCWMIFEAVPFGVVSRALNGITYPDDREVAAQFGMPAKVLKNWIHCLSYFRNLCAHHERLWNRTPTIKPTIAKGFRDDLSGPDLIYRHFAILQILLDRVAPDNSWAERLLDLIADYPEVAPSRMGFPNDWTSRPIWGLRSPEASK